MNTIEEIRSLFIEQESIYNKHKTRLLLTFNSANVLTPFCQYKVILLLCQQRELVCNTYHFIAVKKFSYPNLSI